MNRTFTNTGAACLLPAFLLALCPALSWGQPIPSVESPSGAVTYGPHGETYQTFETPTGQVTYGPGGQRWETFKTPTGSVTYGPGGERWQVFQKPTGDEKRQPFESPSSAERVKKSNDRLK